jgi:hypothetical protein
MVVGFITTYAIMPITTNVVSLNLVDVFKYRFYFCYQWITVFEILLSRVEKYHNTLVLEGESVYDQIVKAVLQFKISSLMTVERKLAGIDFQ